MWGPRNTGHSANKQESKVNNSITQETSPTVPNSSLVTQFARECSPYEE